VEVAASEDKMYSRSLGSAGIQEIIPMTLRVATTVDSKVRYEIDVTKPYRLDLTVSVLRRLSTNTVDVITPEGEYVRVLDGFRKSVLVRVTQTQPAALTVVIEGCDGPDECAQALAAARRILGVERKLSHFYSAAKGIPWLWPLAVRMRGVKPPRYPTLWEACVNAIVFQQVSLIAASSISRRLILALSSPVRCGGIALYAFPGAEALRVTTDGPLRAAGLSTNKLATLRRVADAILSGSLDEKMLEERPSLDAAMILREIKGIGPWTATVILLRGLARLDVFPMNDSSVARNLVFVAGAAHFDIDAVLTALGPQRGMLYYHLLLARLNARGDIGRASFT
jgi:DNA-3-methyladenine glycosylase II